MNTLALHLSSLLLARLRTPAAGEDLSVHLEHAVSAAEADVARLALDLAGGAHDVRVVAVVPGRGVALRSTLARTWTRSRDEGGASDRPPETWIALNDLAERLRGQGAEVVAPAPESPGATLDLTSGEIADVAGLMPSSRDVLAMMATEHRDRADGSTLRILTTRPSVAALLDTQHAVDVALLVDGAWKLHREGADLAAWARWPGSPKAKIPRLLLPDYEALASLPGVGEATALGLLRDGTRWRDGGLLAVVAAACAGEKLAIATSAGGRRSVSAGLLRDLAALAGRDARELLAVYRLHPCGYQDAPPVGEEHGPGVVATAPGRERHAAHTQGADVAPHERAGVERGRGELEPQHVTEQPPRTVATPEEMAFTARHPETERPRAQKETPMSDDPNFDDRPARALVRRAAEPTQLAKRDDRYEDGPADPGPAPTVVPRESDDTRLVSGALARAQLTFPDVVKRRRADAGQKGSYSYANLADVVSPTLPCLHAQGIAVSWRVAGDRVFLRLVHGESGQFLESDIAIVAPDRRGGIQALGSALSYLRRYLYVMMVGLVAIDDDDDGAAAMMPEALVRFVLGCGSRDELIAALKKNREARAVAEAALRLFDERAKAA